MLDETYRKAGKLDTQYFAPKFDPERYDLLDIVQDNLLDSADASQHIRAELYKLNVYGRSSFWYRRIISLTARLRPRVFLQTA